MKHGLLKEIIDKRTTQMIADLATGFVNVEEWPTLLRMEAAAVETLIREAETDPE